MTSPQGPDRYRPLCQLADGHRRLGYQAAAAHDQVTAHCEYQAALGLVRQLAAIGPADPVLLRELAAGHHREGGHAAVMGYSLAARYEYQAELVLLPRLAQDRPQDLRLPRGLAGAHATLADPATGDLLRTAMESAAAESAAVGGAAGEAVPPEPGPQSRDLAGPDSAAGG